MAGLHLTVVIGVVIMITTIFPDAVNCIRGVAGGTMGATFKKISFGWEIELIKGYYQRTFTNFI